MLKKLSDLDFRPQDLRRTAASLMTSTGTPLVVVQKILNHVETGVTAVYDRYSYDDEKRVALEAWGRQVAAIVVNEHAASKVSSGSAEAETPRTILAAIPCRAHADTATQECSAMATVRLLTGGL